MQISDECGDIITGYEIIYYQPSLRDFKSVLTTEATINIGGLRPYSVYNVKVCMVVQIGASQRFVSNFSQTQIFMTSEGGMCMTCKYNIHTLPLDLFM